MAPVCVCARFKDFGSVSETMQCCHLRPADLHKHSLQLISPNSGKPVQDFTTTWRWAFKKSAAIISDHKSRVCGWVSQQWKEANYKRYCQSNSNYFAIYILAKSDDCSKMSFYLKALLLEAKRPVSENLREKLSRKSEGAPRKVGSVDPTKMFSTAQFVTASEGLGHGKCCLQGSQAMFAPGGQSGSQAARHHPGPSIGPAIIRP